jgi:hypothetical protein
MKLKDTIILSLAVAFFLMGLHQTVKYGIMYSYWLIMLSVAFLLWFNLRKQKNKKQS